MGDSKLRNDKGVSDFCGPDGEHGDRPTVRLMPRDAALRAGREPIGLWDLMLWAYGREMVRATCGTDFKPAGWTASDHSSLAWAIAAASSGSLIGGGEGNAWAPACCHDDALAVHGAVLKVIVGIDRGLEDSPARREAFQLLIKHAELGSAPTWDPETPAPRCLPVLRPNGKPKCMRGETGRYRGHAIACLVRYEGYSDAAAAALRREARARYARWIALLDQVIHMLLPDHGRLIRWRLTGLGVERSPWISSSSARG